MAIRYDAQGTRLSRTIYSNGQVAKTIVYVGAARYESNTLVSLGTDEGRAVLDPTTSQYIYEYQYHDHLGNLRLTYRAGPDGKPLITQETHYDPWGVELVGITSQSRNPDLFQGKERQEEFGLLWDDFGARQYDPQLGRWHGVDAMAGAGGQERFSPYSAMLNNPVNITDPDGNCPVCIGFMVGIFASSIGHMIRGTQPQNIGQFLLPGVIGAAGAGVGGAVLGAFGNAASGVGWSSVGAYATSGAAAGFVGGGINALATGGNFWQQAGMGALTGGVLGAGAGALQHLSFVDMLYQDRTAFQPPPTRFGGTLRAVTVTAKRSVYTGGARASFLFAEASGVMAAVRRPPPLASGATYPVYWETNFIPLLPKGALAMPTLGASSLRAIPEIELKTLNPTHYITRSKSQMQNLVNDIRANGIQESIKYVEHQGERFIVDGHHRYFAAQRLGIMSAPAQRVTLPYGGYTRTGDLMLEGTMPSWWRHIR